MQQTDSSKQEFSTIKRMQAHPLDRYNKISSISALNVEHPMNIRFSGMGPIWVEDIEQYYCYSGGTANVNFVPFFNGSAKIRTYNETVLLPATMLIEIEHNLNTQFVDVTFRNGPNAIDLQWKVGDIASNNQAHFITVYGQAETIVDLKVFIVGKIALGDDFLENQTFTIGDLLYELTSTGFSVTNILTDAKMVVEAGTVRFFDATSGKDISFGTELVTYDGQRVLFPNNTNPEWTIAAEDYVNQKADEANIYTDDAITALLDGVDASGDTLQKLYNLILTNTSEITVADIASRDAYDVPTTPFNIFVLNDGDGQWATYKATTTGIGATFVKTSDPDLLNAAMSASAIKAAYESNADTNAYTNAEKAKLGGIASGATANDTDANLKNRANHTGSQLASTISNFSAATIAVVLTGLSLATGGTIASTDTILQAFGKLQYQITNLLTFANVIAAIGYTPANLANKQNSMAADGTGTKFPTVDAVNDQNSQTMGILYYYSNS